MKKEEGHKPITGEQLSEIVMGTPSRLLSEDEKIALNEKTKSGYKRDTTYYLRIAGQNKDMILLGLLIVSYFLSGLLIGVLILSVAHTEVKAGFSYLLTALLFLTLGVCATIAKIYTNQGDISRKLCTRLKRPKEQLGEDGRTLPGVDRYSIRRS